MTGRFSLAFFAVSIVSFCGCNGFPFGNPNPNTTPQLNLEKRAVDVTVVAPSGMTPPTTVKTSLGEVGVASGTAAGTPIYNEGPQFAMATDVAGNIQLMGFVGTGAAEINSHTTAEVLLFFSLNAPLLPGAAQEYVLGELKKHPAVQTLADAIAAALASDGTAVAKKAPAIQTALHAARDQIMNATAKSKSPASASRVLINPSDAQSGITINQLGLNSITIRNDFRRRAYYYVEAMSYVPQGGGAPVESHLDVSEHSISPTTGVTSAFGLIKDVMLGNEAYTGVDSDPIELPVIPNSAESTTYKITVVGPGTYTGDYPSLTAAKQDKQRQLLLEAFVIDFFVPAFVDLFLPIKADQIDKFFERAHVNDLAAGLISAVGNAVPQAIEKARAGDLKGGLSDLWDNVLSDGSARLVILEAMYQFLNLVGVVGPGDGAGFTKFAEDAIRPLDAFDSIFIGFDSLIQVVQFAQSSEANTWMIVSDRSKVRLDPGMADISLTDSLEFHAVVPDASGSDATIVYHWSTSGDHGEISDGQHFGKDFDSSKDAISFDANSIGKDTVTVEAFEVRNQARLSLGKATANIKVRDAVPSIVPNRVSLNKNESSTFTASIDASLNDGGTLSYRWFSSTKFGQITQPPPNVETHINTATFTVTGTPPGEDTVACEVFSTKNGVKTSLGIARAQVKIEQRKTIIMGSFNVEVQFAQPGFTGTPGYSFVTAYAKVPKVEGATSYSCRIYNFYDGAYWGHGTTFSDGTIRSAEDRNTEYWIGLTGGQARNENVAESVAQAEARFVGIIVEVTVTY